LTPVICGTSNFDTSVATYRVFQKSSKIIILVNKIRNPRTDQESQNGSGIPERIRNPRTDQESQNGSGIPERIRNPRTD